MGLQGMVGESVYEQETSQDNSTWSNDNYWLNCK